MYPGKSWKVTEASYRISQRVPSIRVIFCSCGWLA